MTYEDLGSKNGSFRNGQRLRGVVEVAHGHDIMVGAVTVTFLRIRDDTTESVEHNARQPRR